jgi:hypothetical protein
MGELVTCHQTLFGLPTTLIQLFARTPKLCRTGALRRAMQAHMNDKSAPLDACPAFRAHSPSSDKVRFV